MKNQNFEITADPQDPNVLHIVIAGLGNIQINRTYEGVIVDAYDLSGHENIASMGLTDNDFIEQYMSDAQDAIDKIGVTLDIDPDFAQKGYAKGIPPADHALSILNLPVICDQAVERTSVKDAFKIGAALNAVYAHLNELDPQSEGSEVNVQLANTAVRFTEKAVGHSYEDDEEWLNYSLGASAQENALNNIQQLLAKVENTVPLDKRLYLVVTEELFRPHAWLRLIENGELHIEPSSIDIWSEERFTPENGWTKAECSELNSLEVAEGVACYSDHAHTIIRIK